MNADSWCGKDIGDIPPPPPPPPPNKRISSQPVANALPENSTITSQYYQYYQNYYQSNPVPSQQPQITQSNPLPSHNDPYNQSKLSAISSVFTPQSSSYITPSVNASKPKQQIISTPLYNFTDSTSLNPVSKTSNIYQTNVSTSYPSTSSYQINQNKYNATNTETIPPPAKTQQLPNSTNSFKEFVNRAFINCETDSNREFVTNHLRKLIATFTKNGTMNTHRWDLESIPTFKKEVKSVNDDSNSSNINSNNGIYGSNTNYNMISPKTNKKRKNRFKVEDNETSRYGPASDETSHYGPSTSSYQSQGDNEQVSENKNKNKNSKKNHIYDEIDSIDNVQLKNRSSRFNSYNENKYKNNIEINIERVKDIEFNPEKLKIIGTCTKLEKHFLRLTSAPDKSNVRPEHILKQATIALKEKINSKIDFDYISICSQLKAIRQDISVQHIVNEFTVEIYELHARVALECSDLNEYNQCQTQLLQFYRLGIKGCEMEFTAYLILYYVYLQGNKKYQHGSSDLIYIISRLEPSAFIDPAIAHALKIRKAIQMDNYHAFFQLYKETPYHGNYILNTMLDTWRLQGN
jgi:hypothetical protein